MKNFNNENPTVAAVRKVCIKHAKLMHFVNENESVFDTSDIKALALEIEKEFKTLTNATVKFYRISTQYTNISDVYNVAGVCFDVDECKEIPDLNNTSVFLDVEIKELD